MRVFGHKALLNAFLLAGIWLVSKETDAYRYVPDLEDWNLNENQFALSPTVRCLTFMTALVSFFLTRATAILGRMGWSQL